MNGITHCLIGFVVGEICWQIVKKRRQSGSYSRGWFWLIGLIGGYSPDFDGLSGISANITTFNDVWEYETLLRYHHDFTHSLLFLFTAITLIIVMMVADRKFKSGLNWKQSNHPMGKLPMDKERGSPLVLTSFILSFLLYRDWNKFFVLFSMIALLVLLGYMYIREGRPWYGVAFFAGIISHLAADFIANNFQPFGPWNTEFVIGLRLIYDVTEQPQRFLMMLLLEGPFYFAVVGIIVTSIIRVNKFNSQQASDKSISAPL